MTFSPTTVGALLVVAILLAAAALGVAAFALHGQRRVRRAYRTFSMGSRDDVLTLLARHLDEVGNLRGDVRDLRRYADELRELARGAVSKVGTVRYDAFDELGGRLSFSTALLDERGDGVIISAINGRTDTRIYAKPVVNGTSRNNLSQEESTAIERALAGQRDAVLARPRRGPPAGSGVEPLDEAAADAS